MEVQERQVNNIYIYIWEKAGAGPTLAMQRTHIFAAFMHPYLLYHLAKQTYILLHIHKSLTTVWTDIGKESAFAHDYVALSPPYGYT